MLTANSISVAVCLPNVCVPSWNRLPGLFALLAVIIFSGPASAYTVYKSVDAQGNVTYSTHPPMDARSVEHVHLQPPLSRDAQQAAVRREGEIEAAAEAAAAESRARAEERAESVEATRRDVAVAKRKLEEALIMRDDDWQGVVAGGRRLKPSYHERVGRAQAELADAERRHKQALRTRRQ